MNKHFKVCVVAIITGIGFFVLAIVGVRITIEPDSQIDWGKTAAVVTCIVAFPAIFTFLLGEKNEPKSEPKERKSEEEMQRLEEKAYDFICQEIAITTKRIANELGLTLAQTRKVLKHLETSGRIQIVGKFHPDDKNCTWKAIGGK